MYEHLENLEWFSPMPYDNENVLGMITSPRFYIIGAFDGDKLLGVSSLDYKCGKLIGEIEFPKQCNTNKLVEVAFNIVHSDARGQGLMSKLVEVLNAKIKQDGFEWTFSKVHVDNFASSKSLLKNGFEHYITISKKIKRNQFEALINAPFFNAKGKQNGLVSLQKQNTSADYIFTDYTIYIKQL